MKFSLDKNAQYGAPLWADVHVVSSRHAVTEYYLVKQKTYLANKHILKFSCAIQRLVQLINRWGITTFKFLQVTNNG